MENFDLKNPKYHKANISSLVDIQKLVVQQKANSDRKRNLNKKRNFEIGECSNKNSILNREIKINVNTNKKKNFKKIRGKPKKVKTAQRQDKTVAK